MIVVDTNLLAYAVLEDPQSENANAVKRTDPDWAAPGLWVYEFQNIVSAAVKAGRWDNDQAQAALRRAGSLIVNVQEPHPHGVFELVRDHKITAYDAQYVALAQELGVPLVTEDKELLRKVPGIACSMGTFLASRGGGGVNEIAARYRVPSGKRSRPRR